MNKAVFLDRDGVIIRERGEYNYLPEHINFVDGIEPALKKLDSKGYLLIVISNQSGIEQGLYSIEDADRCNKTIADHLFSGGVSLKDFFYCPHHPSTGNCICRKPDSLLLEKAMAIYDIDPGKSYMVGDMDRDIEAALKAGLAPVKINPNDDLNEYLYMIE